MPSLSDCVLSELEGNDLDVKVDPVDLFAQYDLDIDAISAIDGAWEPVDILDPTQPHIDGIPDDAFTTEGPSVYRVEDYLVVRGREDVHHVFFVFEPTR